MVVCQGLAGGSRVFGGLAGSGQVGQLALSLSGLVHDVLSYRAWENIHISIYYFVENIWVKYTIGNGIVGSCGIWTDMVSWGGLRQGRMFVIEL